MKKLAIFLCAVAFIFSVAGNVGATPINITPTTVDRWAGPFFYGNDIEPNPDTWEIKKNGSTEFSGDVTTTSPLRLADWPWDGTDYCNPKEDDIPSVVDSGTLYELYKQDVGGPEGGFFAPNYQTTFYNEPLDPEEATITWGGGANPFIGGDHLYLLVKDGCSENTVPWWYIFDISSWNGQDTLDLQNFWPAQGAISHVSIYGGSAPVPEPATLLLLGSGLIGLAGIGRKKILRSKK